MLFPFHPLAEKSSFEPMTDVGKICVLFDGECPICCRKVTFLEKRDRRHALVFSDIRAENFQIDGIDVPFAALEAQIHAVLPDGSVVSGMEVIRAAYRAIGLGWLAAPTGWPLLRPLFDALYYSVAKNRHRISRLFNKPSNHSA
ncbi:MAG: DUF393 domain-containing protein [Pontiella sp.]|nr:DUF393 domain-containing protein [Pontiella sp.]